MLEHFVTTMFGLPLFTTAVCFIPQALKILKTKSASSISLITFVGFNIGQIFSMWHAYYIQDWIFFAGTAVTFITSGAVTVLALHYGKSKHK